MQRPLISICIPTYESASTIDRCLTSILAQEFDDFEVLIVDDRSTDDTVARVEQFGGLPMRLIINDVNQGLVGNHNRCLELARGRFVQFVHADDYLLSTALRAMSSCFINDSSVTLAVSSRVVVSDDSEWAEKFGHLRVSDMTAGVHQGDDFVRKYLKYGRGENWLGEPTCVMFDRDRALSIGGFNPKIAQLLDMDLWLRLIVGSRFALVEQPQSVRVQHSGTTTVRNRESRRDWLDVSWTLAGIAAEARVSTGLRVAATARWVAEIARVSVWLAVRGDSRRAELVKALRQHVGLTLRRMLPPRKKVTQ